ncbi:MAG TPA: hypothetical protein VGH73_17890 [Thermoanaerobaculia bacterium]|jgi:hypothetical protein
MSLPELATFAGLLVLLGLGIGGIFWLRGRRRRRPSLSPVPENNVASDFLYDAFASYATDPDGALVRDVEVFVESLRENKLVAPAYRRTLELYVDGSDFSIPRRSRGRSEGSAGEPDDEVFDLIRAYMEKCRHFLLFVGPRSARHPWIQRELAWWLDHRDEESILVAVTHGSDPKNHREQTFPKLLVDRALDRKIWIDLRGFGAGPAESLISLRPYAEERLRLTAFLLGPTVSAADLIAGWKLAAARFRRRQAIVRAGSPPPPWRG